MESNVSSENKVFVHSSCAASTGDPGSTPTEGLARPDSPDIVSQCLGFKPKYLDPGWQYEGRPKTKFNEDYPPDAWGEEAEPNARVWKIYRDKSTKDDSMMLDTWNKTLDVLLIFAGLFSAVSTAFIVESYKSLQPDYTRYIANVLHAAVTTNQTEAGFIGLPLLTRLGPPDSFVLPSTTERWTNGMWFSSLVVSLAVALLSILIKQWLDEYERHVATSAPSPQHWARRHQLYLRGLNAWGVPALISLLPLLLHVSLFLFFAGLVLFLRPLDKAIANTLLAMISGVLLFYVLSLVFPACRLECPSYTPLVSQARSAVVFGLGITAYLIKCLHLVRGHSGSGWKYVYFRVRDALLFLNQNNDPLKREGDAINSQRLDLDGWVLRSLLSTADKDIVSAGVEALGAVTAGRTFAVASSGAVRNVICAIISPIVTPPPDLASNGFAIMTYAKLIRAAQLVHAFAWLPLRCPQAPDLSTVLGGDGTLLVAAACDFSPNYFDIIGLSTFLKQQLAAQISNSPRSVSYSQDFPSFRTAHSNVTPHRLLCFLFLARLPSTGCDRMDPDMISCALLVLCAGHFHLADGYERSTAMQFVAQLVAQWIDPLDKFDSNDDFASLNVLYALASNPLRYGLESETVRIFVHHLRLLGESIVSQISGTMLQWSTLRGIGVFVLSTEFEQYVGREEFASYIHLLDRVDFPNIDDTEQCREYCLCAARLLRIFWTVEPWPGFNPSEAWGLVLNIISPSGRRPGPLAAGTSDAILHAFILGENAVATWTEERWMHPQNHVNHLACILSSILCNRQRNRNLDEKLVDAFFSGTFVVHRFRTLIDSTLGTDNPPSDMVWRGNIMPLALHCAELSPPLWARVCAALAMIGDDGSLLRTNAVHFLDAIRELMPGGENPQCTENCDCMNIRAVTLPGEMPRHRPWRDRIMQIVRYRSPMPLLEEV